MSRPIFFVAGALGILLGISLTAVALSLHPANGQLDLKYECKPTLLTVAYKAYATPSAANGKYWLGKTVMHNTGASSIKNIKISYEIPDLITWTDPDEMPELLPDQTAVFNYYPKLPSSVTQNRTDSTKELHVKIDYTDNNGPQEKTQKFEFTLRGVTKMEWTSLPFDECASWYDFHDNDDMMASFVMPEDPVVKAYMAYVSDKFGGGIDVVEDDKSLFQFGKAIYSCMLATGMTYSAAADNIEKQGDAIVNVQSIRLPRDVIQDNTGLCVELALLWASLGEAAGCDVQLVSLQGHCFVILVAGDGTRMPVECTRILGGTSQHGALPPADPDFQNVVNIGIQEYQKLVTTGAPHNLLDVKKLQGEGFIAPELSNEHFDSAAFRTAMDNLIAEHRPEAVAQQQQQQPQQQQQQPQPANNGQMVGWTDPTQSIMVPYPGNWQVASADQMQQLQQQIQQLNPGASWLLRSSDPQSGMIVNAFGFQGNNPQTVMQNFSDLLQKAQVQPQVGQPNQTVCDSVQCVAYPLSYVSSNVPYSGVCIVVPNGNTSFIVEIAAPVANEKQQSVTDAFSQIVGNIKVKH